MQSEDHEVQDQGAALQVVLVPAQDARGGMAWDGANREDAAIDPSFYES